jgi:hypothetical protein
MNKQTYIHTYAHTYICDFHACYIHTRPMQIRDSPPFLPRPRPSLISSCKKHITCVLPLQRRRPKKDRRKKLKKIKHTKNLKKYYALWLKIIQVCPGSAGRVRCLFAQSLLVKEQAVHAAVLVVEARERPPKRHLAQVATLAGGTPEARTHLHQRRRQRAPQALRALPLRARPACVE